ncbi:MAG: DNA polymerase III subunit gamma/tau [Candidatus Bipolaricaulia bacterium]
MSEQVSHLSLYRRWRPQRFGEIVNQTEIIRTLRNAVVAGEAAHAYLFSGERGIGKTSVARILSRALNCLSPDQGEPCNVCGNCTAILSNRSLDIVEIDGASNRGIDHIRRLREEVNFSPTDLTKKVYIIDEVHMLTNEAFNALLKTLEEPPPHAVFVFATTEPHKVPSTIVSRCQAFEFRKIPPSMISERLREIAEAEDVSLTPEALDVLAHRANGGMRDAIVMLEQAISYERELITGETVLDMLGLAGHETHQAFAEALETNDRGAALEIIDTLVERGKDLEIFLADVIQLMRDRLANAGDRADAGPGRGGGGSDLDIAVARGLLDVKSDLFRSLDRRIRLEIGVLDLMTRLPASRTAATSSSAPSRSADVVTASPARPTDSGGEAKPLRGSQKDIGVQDDKPLPETGTVRTEAAAPDLGTTELDEQWAKMLAEIGQERIAIAAFLTECRPEYRNDRLVLLFHPSHTFHKESLEKGPNLQYLAGVVHRHFGESVYVEVEFDPSVERKPTARELLREKAELVCRMFDGKIVKEEL